MADENQFNSEGAKNFSDQTKKASDNLLNVTKRLKELAEIEGNIGQGFNNFLDSAKQLSSTLGENRDTLQKIETGQLNLNEAQKLQAKLKEDTAKLDRTADNMAKQLLGKKSNLTKEEKNQVKEKIDSIKKAAAAQNQEMDDAVKKAAKGETFLAKGFDKLGDKMRGLGMDDAADGISEIGQGVRETAIAGGGMFKQLLSAVGVMKIIKSINPFGLILSALTFIVKTMLSVNQQITELGRSLGVSTDRARDIRVHFQNVANSVAMAGVEVEEVLKAQESLNDALGTSVTMISKDLIGGMAVLVERFGVSAEAAANLALSALAGGKSVEYMADEIRRGGLEASSHLGVNIDNKKILEASAKITGETRVMFWDNARAMGETVAKAQVLGRTMNEIKDQSKGFLDFQSSISKEMEAEIFLGKQLNLDRARSAALTGDLKTFQEEITREAGTFLEFTQMSTMERQKLAEALNMNVDALSDMLLKTADLDALEGSIEEKTLEQLKAREKQLSVQEAFEAAIKRLQNMLINLVAKMEGATILGVKLDDLTNLTDETIAKMRGGQQSVNNANVVGVANEPGLKVNDFIIKTHPKDTLVMAGGTQLGEGNGITQAHLKELIEVSKTNRTFSYDGFAAVKEAGHYGTKFS
tara:strand:- start:418 stop:2340 length:1923 start_codon:yes stop_codon:yes gene_type:complete